MAKKVYGLISWVALNNDPYSIRDGEKRPGPTLTLLFNEKSPYKGKIKDVWLLHQDMERAKDVFQRLKMEIENRDCYITVHSRVIMGLGDPTDHGSLFEKMKREVEKFREYLGDRPMLIHVSPGTPAMHTIWVLMASTGMVKMPFEVVQSYLPGQREDGEVVKKVEIPIETFFKVFHKTRVVGGVDSSELLWDPSKLKSEKMKKLFEEVSLIARVKVPILILGERGTGKTSLAKWIRANSPFRKKEIKQWPVIACGQFLKETLRDELFGHEKGAFTGADAKKEGLLKKLNGDTLFLDEIGDLDKELQRILIRVMEEKEFMPLGSQRSEKSDFRLITSTNLPVDRLRKQLDPDFFDRISYFVIKMPALREVPEEIPQLWPEILKGAEKRLGHKYPSMTEEQQSRLIDALQKHTLPGNFRDLYRVAYHLIAYQELGIEGAINKALTSLTDSPVVGKGLPRNREIAYRFAVGESILDLLKEGKLDIDSLEKELHKYIALEVDKAAYFTHKKRKDLIDRTERTLREWKK